MKLIKMVSAFIAVIGLTVAGCSNSDMESRVARLEGRLAELEGSGTTTNRLSNIASPAETTANQPEVKPDGPLPEFTFAEESHDFGTINEGDEVEYVFTFVNTGQAPLIISKATGSCGCTVPQWSKEPIGVGESGEIKVKFNSRKKPGVQNKTVTITSNTYPRQKRIKIKATVTPVPKDDDTPL